MGGGVVPAHLDVRWDLSGALFYGSSIVLEGSVPSWE